jgi:short-subunit dehydrogenase
VSEWSGRLAVVTGASSGIGEAVARRLAREGLRVVLCARRVERLEALASDITAAGGQAEAFPADLTEEAGRAALHAHVMAHYGGTDVLVNNAGMAWYGYFSDSPWRVTSDILALNIAAVTHLTGLFLGPMRARNQGHIINIGSMNGLMPTQGSAVYGASKAFVDSFTTSLARELAGTGVRVSVVRAGPVRSEIFTATAARENGRPLPGEGAAISCERVAGAVWSLLRRPRRAAHVPGWVVLIPWVELLFGWLMDRVGPLLLERGG